jgi:HAD superfamily hydrolase (TIGR01509 family)
MTIRYVLWDNDGVLVDTEGGYFDATRRALAECGITLDRAHYMQIRARGDSAWQLAIDAKLPPETIARHRDARDEYYQTFIAGSSLEIPGVHDVLDRLSARYRMAIVTTSKRRDFDLIHRERRLVRHMQFVLTREDFVKEKPAPDSYLAALARFGARPEEAVVIEDSAQGLNAARAAGIRCIVVHNGFFGDMHEFDGAVHKLRSIADVPDALAGLGETR